MHKHARRSESDSSPGLEHRAGEAGLTPGAPPVEPGLEPPAPIAPGAPNGAVGTPIVAPVEAPPELPAEVHEPARALAATPTAGRTEAALRAATANASRTSAPQVQAPTAAAPPVEGRTAQAAAHGTRAGEARPAPEPQVDLERTAEVFRQLKLHLTPATRHAVLQLVPAELGRIAIHLSVRGGKVSGEIRADRAETLAILEAHEPELRAALEQHGLDSADLHLARHGDPSQGRPDEMTSPLSEPIEREQERAPEVEPAAVLSILSEDRVDTLA